MRLPNKRCRYVCSIEDTDGRPQFRVRIDEPTLEELQFVGDTPRNVWTTVLTRLRQLRRDAELTQIFPDYVHGEDLFGLTEPAVVRILESLPGIESLTDYRFKYGRNPLIELPLAINPTGAARTEPKASLVVSWRKPHTQRSATPADSGSGGGSGGGSNGNGGQKSDASSSSSSAFGLAAAPYTKQFVHSKSSQYKKMKQEWRNNLYMARSKIQGLGLYAAKDVEKDTMLIEYIGEVIRSELSEFREKQYEAKVSRLVSRVGCLSNTNTDTLPNHRTAASTCSGSTRTVSSMRRCLAVWRATSIIPAIRIVAPKSSRWTRTIASSLWPSGRSTRAKR